MGNEQIYTFAGETVQLEVAASDDVAIADVHFYRWDAADETWRLLGVAQSAPFRRNLDTSTLADEWNQIVALAYDTAGNESAHVHIWLRRQSDEPQPTITPTQPPTATPTITPTATATPLPTATPLATADAPTPPYRAYLPLLR